MVEVAITLIETKMSKRVSADADGLAGHLVRYQYLSDFLDSCRSFCMQVLCIVLTSEKL